MKKPRVFFGWYMVAVSWAFIFLHSAVAIGIFFKPMLEDFGWDRATLSLVQSIALVVITVTSPFWGRLIDRFGARITISASVIIQVLSRAINGLATNIWHLCIARYFYGITTLTGSQVLINNWFVKRRGVAQGILATGLPAGTLVLTPVSQYLIGLWGWRPTMLFWALVALVVMLPLALIIRNNPEDKGYGPDGEPVSGAGKVDLSPEYGDVAPEVQLGVSKGIGFPEVLRDRSFWFLGATHLICGIGCGFTMTHIVIFATDMGYSDMTAASLVSVQGGVCLVGVLFMGAFSDRIGRRKALSLTHFVRGMAFLVIVMFILLGGGHLWLLYAAMALFGFGWFTAAALVAGLIADLFGRLRMGTILGVLMSCHQIGMALGAYAGGAIFEWLGSYYLFYLLHGPLELLAACLALSIRRTGVVTRL